MYCAASMLPCGRYYYDPEGGYVGNPWVKFSYQYAYLYMAWIVHHLDALEHYSFQLSHTFTFKYKSIYRRSWRRKRWHEYMRNVNNLNDKWAPEKMMKMPEYKSLYKAWRSK